MLSSKPVNAKLINCMKSTLIFQINCNKSSVLCWRVNSTSYTSPVLAFNKGFLVATKINCIPLIWLFRVTVASATPSPSGPFNTLPVTEKPITWKTGWNGKKLTSVFTQEMQTHTYSNQHQLFSLHTHIKETYFQLQEKNVAGQSQWKYKLISRHTVPLSTKHTFSVYLHWASVTDHSAIHKALCKPEKPTGPSPGMWQSQRGNVSNLEDYCLCAAWTWGWT